MSRTPLFEMDNWSLADDLTCLYLVDNEGLRHCRRSNCQEQVRSVAGSRTDAQLEMFSDLHYVSELLQEKLLPIIGFLWLPLCLVYFISMTMSLITTTPLGERNQVTQRLN